MPRSNPATADGIGNGQLPLDLWTARGLSMADRERWLSAGLGFGDAVLASLCVSVGLTPADLRLRLDGRAVVARLRGGESVGGVAHALRMQQHGDLLKRLDGQDTTTILGIDGQPESDVDRLISGLTMALFGHVGRSMCICCDDLAIRAFVDGNGAEFRVCLLYTSELPTKA